MSNGNSDELGNFLTIPCLLSCCLALSAVVLVSRTSYDLGANSKDRGNRPYQVAFWTLCLALLSVSSAFAVVKVLE